MARLLAGIERRFSGALLSQPCKPLHGMSGPVFLCEHKPLGLFRYVCGGFFCGCRRGCGRGSGSGSGYGSGYIRNNFLSSARRWATAFSSPQLSGHTNPPMHSTLLPVYKHCIFHRHVCFFRSLSLLSPLPLYSSRASSRPATDEEGPPFPLDLSWQGFFATGALSQADAVAAPVRFFL